MRVSICYNFFSKPTPYALACCFVSPYKRKENGLNSHQNKI